MSIQAIKAVEIGDGAELAGRRGSEAHDAIRMATAGDDEPTARPRPGAATSATPTGPGGSRAACPPARPSWPGSAMKPLATLNRPVLGTVDVVTKESTVSFKERTDVTAVPAMGVVAETMMALVLASEALRKFGGDSVAEFRRNRDGYLAVAGRDALGGPAPPPMADRLLLVGMMGAGKTTVGPAAGRAPGLGLPRLRRRGGGRHRPHRARALRRRRRGGLPGRGGPGAGRGAAPATDPVVVSVAGGVVLDRGQPGPPARGPGRWCGCGPTRRRWPGGWATAPAGRCSASDPAAALVAARAVRRPLYGGGRTWSSTSTASPPTEVVDRRRWRRRSAERRIGRTRPMMTSRSPWASAPTTWWWGGRPPQLAAGASPVPGARRAAVVTQAGIGGATSTRASRPTCSPSPTARRPSRWPRSRTLCRGFARAGLAGPTWWWRWAVGW